MADIAVRRPGGTQAANNNLPTRELEPYRVFRDLLRWDPFQEMTPLWPDIGPAYLVPFEVKETKDAFQFKADVPGMKEQDVDVTLTGNRLTISGKRSSEKEETGDAYYTCERSYGSFSRSFTLPDGIDPEHIQANLNAGVLTVAVGKKAEFKPKKIAVQAEKAKA